MPPGRRPAAGDARARRRSRLLAAALWASAGASAQAQTCRGDCVTPSVVAQLRFTASAASDATAAPLVELRRLRPTLRLSALDGRLLAQVGLNTTPAALEVIDAWAEYAVTPALRLRGGQAKVSFTSYRMRPFTELAFVDWALVTRYFGGERQLGFELHNRGGAVAPIEFAAGLWSGATMRAAHGQGVAPVYAEAIENHSDLRAPHPPESPHPELVGRLLWRRPRGARVHVEAGISALVDLRPVAAHDLRAAFAPEVTVDVGPWRVGATGYLGLGDLVERAGLGLLGGALAEVQLRAHERVSVAVRYARVDRSEPLVGDARARAARLVAAAPVAQRVDVRRRYADAGEVVSEHELTAGIVVRLVGATVVWQSDLAWLRVDRREGARDELRGRTQLQLAY